MSAPMLMVTAVALLPAAGILHYMAAQVKNGQLLRNYVMGLRTAKLHASDEAWEVGHRAALPQLYAMAYLTYAVALVCGIGAFFISSDQAAGGFTALVIGGLTTIILWLCWRAVRVAHRAVDTQCGPDDAAPDGPGR